MIYTKIFKMSCSYFKIKQRKQISLKMDECAIKIWTIKSLCLECSLEFCSNV